MTVMPRVKGVLPLTTIRRTAGIVSACVLLLACGLGVRGLSHTPREQPMVVTLANGDVLSAGGWSGCHTFVGVTLSCDQHSVAAAERQTRDGRRQSAGQLTTPRSEASVTLLRDGRVLLAGGLHYFDQSFPETLDSAEIYNPTTNTWTVTALMQQPRVRHVATLMADGRVLVTGGEVGIGQLNITTEVYDPVTNTWQATAPPQAGRWHHTATLLPTGEVLVVGGDTTVDYFAATVERYDPATNRWRSGRDLAVGREDHTAILLPDGRVVVAGGQGPSGPLTSSEYYDPAADRWTAT